ncbi:glycosyltransferase family 4 protein [Lusitaniella coriacea]|uniref:glycosyltransferase family 4 protein n=1 Tax=Lusitaniella coriacea TaxID=1983105 RepID=UPI003CF26F62
MKVSILVSDLSKSGAGRWGGAVRTFLLAQALKKLHYDVEILGFVFGDAPPEMLKTAWSMTTVPGRNYPGFLKSSQTLVGKIDGDVIYALRPKPTTFGLALLKRLQSRKPIILDIDDWELSWHGGDRLQYRPNIKQLARDILKPNGALRYPDHPYYLKWMEKMVSRADGITVHTQFLQDRFGGIYVPNGKDTTLFDPNLCDPQASRLKYGLADYRILMFPGAPRPYKGIEDILTALDKLNRSDLRLVIVGGSPYDDYDQQLIERWGRWIIKLPTFPVGQMPEVVCAAHVVVVPQKDTPAAQAQFPLKLTDGMAMAKPILATRVGDIPEILSNTGILVDPSSPEQLAEKIQWIFENLDAANALGIKARERCIQEYSIDTMAMTLESLLRRFA